MAIQLAEWRRALADGAERIGWKLGLGERERIGHEPAVGHLTSATRLRPGDSYPATDAAELRADAEVFVELAQDVGPDADADAGRNAIAAFGPALELVDLGAPPDDPEEVVAANVFHRAFALGPGRPTLPPAGVEARLIVGGRVRDAATAPDEFGGSVCAVARVLAAAGERLQAGDRIITGSIVQVPVGPGDDVVADLGPLGRVQLSIAR
jgi:2-keto-4-pentenoate hydratase